MDYRTVLDSLADAIVVGDLDDRILHVNPAAERLLGWPASELTGAPLTTLMPARMRPAHEAGLHRFAKTRTPRILGRPVRVPTLRKDGKEIEIELTLSFVAGAPGEEPRVVGTMRDLSDRVELERNLRISRYLKVANEAAAKLTARLDVTHVVKTTTESLVDGFDAALARVWLYDASRNLLLLHASEGLSTRIEDSSRAEIDVGSYPYKVGVVARSLAPLVTNDLGAQQEVDRAWVEREQLRSAAVLPLVVGGELRGVLAAFFRFALPEEIVEALLTFASLAASALNDSLLHAAERAARKRFEDFVNGINHGIVWEAHASTLHVTFVSAKAETLLGYPLSDWYAQPRFWVERVHPDDRAFVLAVLERAVERHEDIGIEHRFVKADGGVIWVHTGARLAEVGPGKGVMIHALSADVTHIKAAEAAAARTARQAEEARAQAEEASRLKDEFLTTVSHELRTPLSAILGWASMLNSDRCQDLPSVQKGMAIIERNARSQLRIVDDILDVSRIVRGQLRVETEPVDLGAVLRDVVDSVRPAADAKQISIMLEPMDGPSTLIADPDRLRQVFWNVLSNAVKFTPPRGHVHAAAQLVSGSFVVEVRDDGQGIDAPFLPYVFDRFRQADGGTTRPASGLGLGLAIVRHLVEAHGGSVSAKSAGAGQGSTFTITLPVKPFTTTIVAAPGPESLAPSAPRSSATHGALSGLRLLVVEDEPDSRELIELLFASEGAEVHAAGSAEEALRTLERIEPDVLVSDIGMPGHDGYWLLQEVRKRRPSIPAVALTAYTRREDMLRTRRAGFDHHVGKPVDPARLVRTIASLRTA